MPTPHDYPRIVTPPPGPRARALIERDERFASPCYIKAYPLAIAGGRGPMVEDVDGNRYLDCMAGIAVASTGYNHPRVVAAVQEQAARFLHICGSDFYFEGMARLMETLARLAPGTAKKRVFLTNSGTEAVEGAIKLARAATGRPGLVAFEGAFHGRTMGSMSLSASKPVHKEGFGPFLPGVTHLPYDAPEHGVDGPDAIATFERFVSQGGLADVAAVFVEPVQGESGYRVPRPEFLCALRRGCDASGALLVADEVQSGIGRTGRMWACDHAGVVPDVLLTAKGLGSGLPIGAIVAREDRMTWKRGAHGSTFGGNPLACAAALVTLELVEAELMDNARRQGEILLAGLRRLAEKHARIGAVRGLGLMAALEIVRDRKSREPDHDGAAALERRCFEHGLLVLMCGKSTIRLAPPLVIDEQDVATALAILDQELGALGAG